MACGGPGEVLGEEEAEGEVEVADVVVLLAGDGVPEEELAVDEDGGGGGGAELVEAGLVAADGDGDFTGEEGVSVVADAGAEGAVGGDGGEAEVALVWPSAGGVCGGVEGGEGEEDHSRGHWGAEGGREDDIYASRWIAPSLVAWAVKKASPLDNHCQGSLSLLLRSPVSLSSILSPTTLAIRFTTNSLEHCFKVRDA